MHTHVGEYIFPPITLWNAKKNVEWAQENAAWKPEIGPVSERDSAPLIRNLQAAD
jgi:hypothetical protein